MTCHTLGLFLLSAILSVTGTSFGLRSAEGLGIEGGRLRNDRPRRSVNRLLSPAVGLPGDQEYGGRFAPLDKRPFGSLFNMKGFGKRDEPREDMEIIPEEDDAVPTKMFENIFGNGYKHGQKEPSTGIYGNSDGNVRRQYENEASQEKRQYGNILGGGFKFGKRGYGGLLGGGFKLGKRGYNGVLNGGYKFGKRGFGGVLGGGYKFGKRDSERQIQQTVSGRENGLEMAKRPWGNLFNKGFQLGKREDSRRADMSDIYRAIISSKIGNRNEPGIQDGGRVMQGAISLAKRLFGSVLGSGYKLG